MNLLSLLFFVFLAVAFAVYYLVPKKGQWIVLLTASLLFYVYATRLGLVVLAAETLLIFFLVKRMETHPEQKKKILAAICILCAVVILILLKYVPEICGMAAGGSWVLKDILLPLGISYYTLMIISYTVDVYRGQIAAERSFAKLLLFAFYFPSITQGPLNRYGDLTPQFYEPHTYEAGSIFEGLMRFGWGCFKKLVIANRTAALIAGIYGSSKATGVLILLAMLLSMLQLYSDFSGFADMAIGISQMFGITLPENFRQPYFSRSIAEYWRRWHITLGAWLKDYIYYPLSVSRMAKFFIKKGADRNARKRRTKLISCIALMILWIIMGVWHGSGWKFFLMGVYYGVIFIVTMLLEPVAASFGKKHPKAVASPLYKFWQQVRTTLLLWLAPLLFSVNDLAQLGELTGKVFRKFAFVSLFDGTILKFDLDGLQLILLLIGFFTLLIVSVIEYNTKKKICGLVLKQHFVIRLLIYWFVIVMILLSLNISNTEFIYAQF